MNFIEKQGYSWQGGIAEAFKKKKEKKIHI